MTPTGLEWTVDVTGRIACEGCADHRTAALTRHHPEPGTNPAIHLLVCADGLVWAAYCDPCHAEYGVASAR